MHYLDMLIATINSWVEIKRPHEHRFLPVKLKIFCCRSFFLDDSDSVSILFEIIQNRESLDQYMYLSSNLRLYGNFQDEVQVQRGFLFRGWKDKKYTKLFINR